MFDFLSTKISGIFAAFSGSSKLTEENMQQAFSKVSDALLEADVPYDITLQFIAQVKQEALGQKVIHSLKPSEQLLKVMYDKLVTFMGGTSSQEQFSFDIPSVVMVLGLQGSGKTTTIAKLAQYVKDMALKRGKKRKIMVASVDFYRPAAVDQLEILAQSVDAIFYRSPLRDPILAAQDIVKQSQKEGCDMLFLDTAGRLHVDEPMLDELKAIDARVKAKYKILIVDAMTGQESLKLAQAFDQQIGFTGAIVTKMDSDTRGGLAFAFKYALKKPILFVTTGEKAADLEYFRPERVASRIIGMGDMMSLVEQANQKIKQADQDALYKNMTQGRMTLEDFAQQIEMVNKLGSLTKLIKYMPGASQFNVSPEMLQKGEDEIKRFKAIISSMSVKERRVPKVIDASRKSRIAQGSGVAVQDVDMLLSRFEQSQKFVKVFKKMGKF